MNEIATLGFFAREKPRFPFDWEVLKEVENVLASEPDFTKVKILRPSLYFYGGQEITLGKLKEYFTIKGIVALEKDGYVKIY